MIFHGLSVSERCAPSSSATHLAKWRHRAPSANGRAARVLMRALGPDDSIEINAFTALPKLMPDAEFVLFDSGRSRLMLEFILFDSGRSRLMLEFILFDSGRSRLMLEFILFDSGQRRKISFDVTRLFLDILKLLPIVFLLANYDVVSFLPADSSGLTPHKPSSRMKALDVVNSSPISGH
jgi:hypothetical protein